MSRKWVFIIIAGLMVGFQNCSQSNLSPQAASADANMKSTASQAQPFVALEIPSNMGILSIDLNASTVVRISGQSNSTELNCMTVSDFEDLKVFSDSYSLCNAAESGRYPNAAQEICTQEYQSPYATLVLNESKVNLGEAFDGCGHGYKDFCGSKASEFQSLLSAIAYKCH